MGRPSKLTTERQEAILGFIRAGVPNVHAAQLSGISEILSQCVARADRLSALALLHAKLPRPGRANINRPDRILPSRLAMVDPTDRRAGRRLFTPAAHAVERGGGQRKLPSSGKGPVVSPNLNRYGVKSAPLYRGLLNLAYTWFDPGVTRIPVRGGKHWLQVEDPERYERITDDLLIELFYPTSAQRERKVLANRARQDLDRLVKDGEARIVKGRLMPPAPREGR